MSEDGCCSDEKCCSSEDECKIVVCEACENKGWQLNLVTGMNEICQVCCGSGIRFKCNCGDIPSYDMF